MYALFGDIPVRHCMSGTLLSRVEEKYNQREREPKCYQTLARIAKLGTTRKVRCGKRPNNEGKMSDACERVPRPTTQGLEGNLSQACSFLPSAAWLRIAGWLIRLSD